MYIDILQHVPPESLLPDWSLCMNILSLYLMHPASTVRQAASKVIKFIGSLYFIACIMEQFAFCISYCLSEVLSLCAISIFSMTLITQSVSLFPTCYCFVALSMDSDYVCESCGTLLITECQNSYKLSQSSLTIYFQTCQFSN